jgi:hypothetical protein
MCYKTDQQIVNCEFPLLCLVWFVTTVVEVIYWAGKQLFLLVTVESFTGSDHKKDPIDPPCFVFCGERAADGGVRVQWCVVSRF